MSSSRTSTMLKRLRRELGNQVHTIRLIQEQAEWQLLQTTLMRTLAPYPDAKAAVARALWALEHPGEEENAS